MGTRRQVATFVSSLVVVLAITFAARADVAEVYRKTLSEVNALEAQLAKAVTAKDADAFVSHFAVPDEEAQKVRDWFGTMIKSWEDDDLDHIEVHLPLLAATSTQALVHLGRIDVHLKTGGTTHHGWPPLVLERRDEGWVIVLEALSPLDPSPGVEVTHATFDVTPQLESSGLIASAIMTVENKTKEPLKAIPVYLRHPLILVETTIDGRSLEAEVSFGEIEGRPNGLLTIRIEPPLKPGKSAQLGFRYSAAYDYHDLGRKPIGFTADRGFILWESGWYPHFGRGWHMFPYDMTITVPRGYKALTSGDLLDERDSEDAHVYSYRMKQPGPPYLLWGRYKETSCQTGQAKMTIWTPIEGDIDPQPMAKLVGEAFGAFSVILPPPALKHHRVVAVTRYGGYGATGNLLLYDPTFSPESIAKTSTLDFVAHELSHSWVNSLASPEGDPPSLLAEGLATYLGAKAVEKSRGMDAAREVWSENTAAFVRDARSPVAPMELTERIRDENNPLFRAVAYVKGAYMFRELESLVGEKVIFRALKEMMLENKGGHFTLKDLTGRLDRLAGQDLTPFWKACLHEATVADYAVESAGSGDSLSRVRVRNHGIVMPTPVEVVAYDEGMREVAREKIVIRAAEGQIVEFKSPKRIAHVAVDPDKRVLQGETRNDTYPDCFLPEDEVAAVEKLMKRMFLALREGDFAVLSPMFSEDAKLLETATRERMLSSLKRSIPLAVAENGPVRVYRTGERRAVVTVAVKLDKGGTTRDLVGEFTLAKSPEGWRLVMFRL